MAAAYLPRLMLPLVAAFAVYAATPSRPASAQAIAAIVNGDPITTTEIDEQMKFRRIVKQPATRDAAMEDLIGDRLKLRAANRAGVDATDASFSQAMSQLAGKANMNSSTLLAQLQQAKVNIDLVRSHLRSLAAWNELVKARYKALSVSQADVDAAIARDASAAKGTTDYTIQQIVFVIPSGATPAVIEQRARAAQALRARFQDCESGVPLARALPDVAVKPQITRSGVGMNEGTRKALEEVERGHLSTPTRIAAGFEMVAVCNKTSDTDRSSVRDTVRDNLLVERLSKQADQMYKDLRARAVVVKR